jgi:putative flavoprotein involved in K+ transport
MNEMHQTVVIGAGQAGLATSWHLKQQDLEHVVLERGRVGETWRSHRWDSFRLQITNQLCQLPGFGYRGDQPDGFMWKQEVVAFFEDYAKSFSPPVREGVTVDELRRSPNGDGWEIRTTSGTIRARNVVVATGAHQEPHVPAIASGIEPGIAHFHTDGYRNPAQLPAGGVVVVGGGSSGGQIAAELALSGRQVYLALGRCAWMMRRYRGRDITDWNEATGFSAQPVQSLEDPAARLACLPMLGVNDNGEDLTPRVLRDMGVTVTGRLSAADGSILRFADDLRATIAAGDGFIAFVKARIDQYIAAKGIDAPPDAAAPPPSALDREPSIRELDLRAAGVTSIMWATGYRNDFSWMSGCEFDGQGYPVHQGGITPEEGLYFMGLPWLTTRGSGFILGVGADAEKVVGQIARRTHASALAGVAAGQEAQVGGLQTL